MIYIKNNSAIRLTFCLLLIALTYANKVKGDTCFRTFKNDSSAAKAIFVGKVVDIVEDKYWLQGSPLVIFTFEVTEYFKGLRSRSKYISLVGPIDGCCNEHFKIDSVYLVFAYGDCNKSTLLYTNDCSNTGLLSESKDLYSLLSNPTIPEKGVVDANFFKKDALKLQSLLNKNKELQNKLSKLSDKIWILEFILIGLLILVLVLIVLLLRKSSSAIL